MSRLPNLKETTEFIKNCIRSCDNSLQLSLCREMIDGYIVKRFKPYAEPVELLEALGELEHEIKEQSGNIILKVYEPNNILTTTN